MWEGAAAMTIRANSTSGKSRSQAHPRLSQPPSAPFAPSAPPNVAEGDLAGALQRLLDLAATPSVPRLLVTLAEAAECLACSRPHLYRLIRKGELHPVGSGRAVRVPVSELERFVAHQLAQREQEGA